MLPMIAVLDARSGKWVKKGQVVRYPHTPGLPDEWWAWYRSRDVGGKKGRQLWTCNAHRPDGYWQPVVPWYGGLVGVFPS